MTRLALYTVLLLACKAWDIYTTWLVTPDLTHELNPLVRAFGGTWAAFLWQQAVFVAVTLWLVRGSLTVNRSFHPSIPGLCVRQFAAGLFFIRPEPWPQLLHRVPTRRGATMYVIGSITLFLAPLAHLQAAISNLLLTSSARYECWFDGHLPWSWFALALDVVPISIGLFLGRDYLAHRRAARFRILAIR